MVDRDQLFAENHGLVHAMARRVNCQSVPRDDLIQAGMIGLWRASLAFDPERGVQFSTYACSAIIRAMHTEARRWRERPGIIEGEATRAAHQVDQIMPDELTLLHQALAALQPLERDVLTARYFGGMTLELTAQRIKRTRERVRQVQFSALDRLRSWYAERGHDLPVIPPAAGKSRTGTQPRTRRFRQSA